MAGQVWYESINQWIALASAAVGLISAILTVVLSAHTIARLGEERQRREEEDRHREEELRLMKAQNDALGKQNDALGKQNDAVAAQTIALARQSEVMSKALIDLQSQVREQIEAYQGPINAEMAKRQEENAAALRTMVGSLRLSENDVVHAKRLVLREKIQQVEARCEELKKLELDPVPPVRKAGPADMASMILLGGPVGAVANLFIRKRILIIDHLKQFVNEFCEKASKTESLKPALLGFHGDLARWKLRYDAPHPGWNQELHNTCINELREILKKHFAVKLLAERQAAEENLGALRREMSELESALGEFSQQKQVIMRRNARH